MHPHPTHARARTHTMEKDPAGKSQPGRRATPSRRGRKCALTRPSPRLGPALAPPPRNFCIRAPPGGRQGRPGPGAPARPPKPFQGQAGCGAAAPSPRPPPALPARLTPARLARLGSQRRDPRGRGPPPAPVALAGPRPRAAAAAPSRAAPAAAVAVRVELGSPPAAGGAAGSRPGDAGRGRGPPAPPASPAPAEREVAANKCKLFGPPGRLGEDPRAGARPPPARVGFAAARRGAGASPPRGAGQMAGRVTAPRHSAPS